jgi:hypothetical protein
MPLYHGTIKTGQLNNLRLYLHCDLSRATISCSIHILNW